MIKTPVNREMLGQWTDKVEVIGAQTGGMGKIDDWADVLILRLCTKILSTVTHWLSKIMNNGFLKFYLFF